VAQLVQYTSLNPRQIRHGLAVLVQQNLLYYQTDVDSRDTSYETNPDACYNLLRVGKVIHMIGAQYGSAAQEVAQSLIALGHARVSDLAQAFTLRINASRSGVIPNIGIGKDDNYPPSSRPASSGHIESIPHLHQTLGRLVEAEIIDVVGNYTFRNPDDMYHEVQKDVLQDAPGEKTTKIKPETQKTIIKRYIEKRDQGKQLKHQLRHSSSIGAKRRKLTNGTPTNGISPPDAVAVIDVGYFTSFALYSANRLRDLRFCASIMKNA
jgi:DNA-directed RNA polymerase III subunit RPC3